MNIPRIAGFLPSLVRSAVPYIALCYEYYLAQSVDEEEEPEEEESTPLPLNEAGRLALEVTMILRSTQGEPERFRRMINEVIQQVDSPQRAADVILSLAGMVGVLAEDQDLERFGKFILAHEVRNA